MERVYFFDGIRGWAALIVLLGHTFNMFPQIPVFHQFYFRVVVDAALAVYVFFVLSGASLSYSIIKNYDELKIKKAIVKRIPRLSIPIFFVTFCTYIIMKLSLMYNYDAGVITGSAWLSSFYDFEEKFSNIFTFSIYKVFFYFAQPVYNASLWTMPHELYGSFFVFIFLLVFKKDILWLPVMGVAAYYLNRFNPILLCFAGGIFISYLLVHFDDFLQSSKIQVLLFVTFCLVVYFLIKDKKMNGLSQHARCIYAFLFCFIFIFFGKFREFFELRVSKFFGKISFVLYLVHLPIMCSLSSFLIVSLPPNIYIYIDLITVFFSIAVARLFVVIDEKSLDISNKLANCLLDDKD